MGKHQRERQKRRSGGTKWKYFHDLVENDRKKREAQKSKSGKQYGRDVNNLDSETSMESSSGSPLSKPARNKGGANFIPPATADNDKLPDIKPPAEPIRLRKNKNRRSEMGSGETSEGGPIHQTKASETAPCQSTPNDKKRPRGTFSPNSDEGGDEKKMRDEFLKDSSGSDINTTDAVSESDQSLQCGQGDSKNSDCMDTSGSSIEHTDYELDEDNFDPARIPDCENNTGGDQRSKSGEGERLFNPEDYLTPDTNVHDAEQVKSDSRSTGMGEFKKELQENLKSMERNFMNAMCFLIFILILRLFLAIDNTFNAEHTDFVDNICE